MKHRLLRWRTLRRLLRPYRTMLVLLLGFSLIRWGDWLTSFLPSPLTLVGGIAAFLVVGALYLQLERLEPNTLFPCPRCGFGNIRERRICKRCRGLLTPPPPQPCPSAEPLVVRDRWIDL